jgi:hypothetical protein
MNLDPSPNRAAIGEPGRASALPASRIAVPRPEPRIDETPRPHGNLLVYYALTSLLLGPFFWAMLIPYYFRYRTLRYRFDDEGVTMSWGSSSGRRSA